MTLLKRLTQEQWFNASYVATQTTSEPLGWRDFVARSTLLNATEDYVDGPATNDDTLVMVVEGTTRLDGYIVDNRYLDIPVGPGSLMIVPRVSVTDGHWRAPVEVFFLHFPPSKIIQLAGPTFRGDPEHISLIPSFGIHDPFLAYSGMELNRELQNQGLMGNLFAEAVTNAVILHLLRKYSSLASHEQTYKGKLMPSQLKILDDYIHAHLSEKITLLDLANCIQLSVPHFEKLFRTTMQRPPYQYVLECRVESAKILLTHSNLSLHEIAHRCGFAHQSHFTRHFTKQVGIPPLRFLQNAKK